jgi:RND family efflux transporter MFP subunit
MAEPQGPSNLLQVLRSEFLPYLQTCRNPDLLSDLLERLASYLGADGAVLWRSEDEHLSAIATYGCADPDWAAAYGDQSAGATALASGAAVLAEADRSPYRPDVCGHGLRQVASFPLRGDKGLIGSVEMWWKVGGSPPAQMEEVLALLEDALNENLPALLEYEAERRNYVNAISRLMMLYDIGKVFHSTLELSEIAPLVAARVQNILEAEGAAVWLVDSIQKNLYCAAAAGRNSAAMQNTRVWASDPGLGQAVSQGQPLTLNDVDDPAWTERWGGAIRSLLMLPLVHGGRLLGVIEAVRGGRAPYFGEEDERLLIDVAKQAAVALRNAQRHQAERRVKELNALMEISKEITSTLDLDRVLATTVNRVTSVIPADRCSISLLRKNKVEVSAISGELQVDRKKPGVTELEELHAWLVGAGGDLFAFATEEGITTDREDTQDRVAGYFQSSGMRAMTGLLLRDEEGVLGVLVLESRDAESLTPSHNDLARIFASQVSVAVRNALLYQQLPLVGVLRPFVEKKSRFASLPALRRRAIVIGGVALLAFLAFFPWYSKPSGEAHVLPAQILPVGPEVDGVIRRMLVREGDKVEAGQALAELESSEHRVAYEQAQAQYDILHRRVLQLEAEGSLGPARIERARLQQVAAELDLSRSRLAKTEIRSPIRGVMITPRLEERVSQFLRRGEVLCQVADLNYARAEIAVPELDVGEIAPGQEAWLKLNAYPQHKFVGKVVQVSAQGREQSGERIFDVVVEVPNDDADFALRAGMMGRGKVLSRRASIGYLMLRVPARWIWLKVWKWLP